MRVKVNRKLILLLPVIILFCFMLMLPGVTGATGPSEGGGGSGDFIVSGCVVSASGSTYQVNSGGTIYTVTVEYPSTSKGAAVNDQVTVKGERRQGTDTVRVYKLTHSIIKTGSCQIAKSVAGTMAEPGATAEPVVKPKYSCCGDGPVTEKLIDKK